MEYRKIIGFGKGSHVISIPKLWMNQNNLHKGNSVCLRANGDALILSPSADKKETQKKTITISADNKRIEDISAEIITAYVNGCLIIDILLKPGTDIEFIKGIISSLAGLEIFEQSSNRIITHFLIDPQELSLDGMVRRMDNIARSLINDILNSSLTQNLDVLSIPDRDKDLNRLYFLIRRIVRDIIRSRETNPWKVRNTLLVASRIEQIGDSQKRIARDLEQLKVSERFLDEFQKVFRLLQEAYIAAMQAYYKSDKAKALSINTTNRERQLACDQLLSRDFEMEFNLIKEQQIRYA